MSVPKLHHYVPQFHLRRFADSSGRLWLWDRDRDRTFQSRPKSVAAESHFYTLTELVENGHDPLTMEKQFADLEDQVAAITEQWLHWLRHMRPTETVEIPEINRELVALYISLQFLRTAQLRDIIAAYAEQAEDRAPLSSDEKRRLHTDMLWSDRVFRGLANHFCEATWIFGRNETATPFVTSDNPVAFRTPDNRKWLKIDVYSPGSYVVFPLAPDIILYCYPKHSSWRKLVIIDKCLSPVVFDKEMVESENSGQVFMASRFLISPRNHFDAERSFSKTIGTDIYSPDR
jgi:hypothetical protein